MDLVPGPSSVKLAPPAAIITQTLAPQVEGAAIGMEALDVPTDLRRILKTLMAILPIRDPLQAITLAPGSLIATPSLRHHSNLRLPPRHHRVVIPHRTDSMYHRLPLLRRHLPPPSSSV